MHFAIPQCFAAPPAIGRIVEPRLGLLGLYSAKGIPAIRSFTGETVAEMALGERAERSC